MRNLMIVAAMAISILSIYSCKDQFDFSTDNLSTNVEQKSEFAIPLVNASITLDEILPDNEETNRYLIIDADDFMRLEFDRDVTQVPATDYFNNVFSGSVVPPITYTISPQVFELGLNKLLNQGEFYLAAPKVTISIINYWDIPAQFKFTDFYYYKEPASAGMPLTGTFDQWIQIAKPVAPSAYAITEIVLDTITSNIDEVISALPHHLSFSADFETITSPPSTYNVPPSSIDSVKMKVEIPLDLRVTNIVLNDTIDFTLGENLGSDTSMIESFEFSMILDNGFPIAIDAQIYFTDANYNILDSISTTGIQVASGVVTDGKVTGATESIIKVNVENLRMANLLKASYLMTKIVFNTANAEKGETVKLYSSYAVGLKLGALIKLQLKT